MKSFLFSIFATLTVTFMFGFSSETSAQQSRDVEDSFTQSRYKSDLKNFGIYYKDDFLEETHIDDGHQNDFEKFKSLRDYELFEHPSMTPYPSQM